MDIDINKATIYAEVAKTTLYAGAKHPDSDMAMLQRIPTIDADDTQLDRYFAEATTRASTTLKHVLESVTTDGQTVTYSLRLSRSADPAQASAIAGSLSSYYVNSIIARWFGLTNRADMAEYAADADAMLDDAARKAMSKRKPQRPRF